MTMLMMRCLEVSVITQLTQATQQDILTDPDADAAVASRHTLHRTPPVTSGNPIIYFSCLLFYF